MPTPQTTFRLTETDLELLDSLATDIGCSRTQAIRYAVRELRQARGLYTDAARAFVDSLWARYGGEGHPLLSVELDGQFDPFALIDGVRQDDIYTAGLATPFDAGDYREDFMKVYVGERASDVRILVAVLPLRSGVRITFPLHELGPEMAPRSLAFPVDG